MKTNACMSSLAELSLESAKWKLKFISAYFRTSFSFKNNDRTCGSLWMHLIHLKGMNVTVLFQQLMVLDNTLYLFFFLYAAAQTWEKPFFPFVWKLAVVVASDCSAECIVWRMYGVLCQAFLPFFNLEI